MCDITVQNFNEKYDEIIDRLRSANFIAIDCEFSGLFDDENKCTLFDTPESRFKKLQNCLENLTIVQFGLTTLKYDRNDKSFYCFSYNFFLKPPTVLGTKKFTCEMKSIEFLCKNNFDFNKLFYDGISYLNKTSEEAVLNFIDDSSLITEENASDIQKYCSRIAEWSRGVSYGSETEIKLDNESETFCYLLVREIWKRFPDIQINFEESSEIKIKKVENCKVNAKSFRKENYALKKKLFHSILGFSRIIKELESLKKPIIGHNLFIDLIMIYKQFYNPSPVSYGEFKKAMSHIFPNIYDTKTISYRLREMLGRGKAWNSNVLSDLYHYLKDGKGANLALFSLAINPDSKDFLQAERFHDAGFDSYITGFCFLKMAYILSLWDEEKNSCAFISLPTSCSWLLAAVTPMKNKVNISRGQVNYIVLDGNDPKSVRPDLLYIQSKTNQPINFSKVYEVIAKYASADIQPLTKFDALIALGNHKQVKEVLECFKNNYEFKVTKYSFLRYYGQRISITVSFIASIVLVAVSASKGWLKPQL